MPFHAATLTPQNRHCQAIMAAWLKLKKRKKVHPAEISIEPPVERRESGFHRLVFLTDCKLLVLKI